MSRKTSFNEIKATIEAGERLTRAQGRSLLSYVQAQQACRNYLMERLLYRCKEIAYAKTDLSRLMKRWNAMISMLHAFLGYKLYDDDTDPSERYRKALEEKMQMKLK